MGIQFIKIRLLRCRTANFILLGFTIYYLAVSIQSPIYDQSTYVEPYEFTESDIPKQSIRILVWKEKGAAPNLVNENELEKCHFPYNQKCEVVTDKALYNSSKAILFQPFYMRNWEFPKHRFSWQKWIYFENEAPPGAWITRNVTEVQTIKDYFNLTSTFTVDSDVPILEGQKTCKLDIHALRNLKVENENYAANKTGNVSVVWFVSHCKTNSLREHYVKELQKYIKVDIVGTCGPGNIKCGHRLKYENCDTEIISKGYKFYLSFENSLCQNYVTEKLWRIIKKEVDAIPIVLGFPNYKELLPKSTFIDIRDFQSPQDLAAYLGDIDSNDELFNSFIRRKKALKCKSKVLGSTSLGPRPYACQLCTFLHDTNSKQALVPDVSEFWGFKRRCKRPDQFYQGVWDNYQNINLTELKYETKYLKS